MNASASGKSYSHCRLCAEMKPIGKLINLETDPTKRSEIVKKLSHLKKNAARLFEDVIMPKTVCLICVETLDNAFEFVKNIDNAQMILRNTYREATKEEPVSDEDALVAGLLSDSPVSELPPSLLHRKIKVEPVRTKLKSQLTWKNYKWMCAKCGTEFPTIEEFKTHSMTYHECCNAFKCTDCNTKMLRLDKFLLHVKRHRKYLKLSCYICNAKFSSGHQVKLHREVHMVSGHICSGCNSVFPNPEDLNQHIKLYYKNRSGNSLAVTDTSDSLTCAICKKTFKTKGSLSGHLLVHTLRTPKKRAHICDRCGKGYYNKADLASHVVTHEDSRPFQCEICKADFKTLLRLKAHTKVHDDYKPHSCVQCGRRFRLKKQLRSHEIIHTDSLPFVCPYCGKAFRFKSILDLHLRQHTGVKPYCCELCQRNFTNWSNYNKHMKRRHGTSMVKRKPNIVVEHTAVSGIANLTESQEKTLQFAFK